MYACTCNGRVSRCCHIESSFTGPPVRFQACVHSLFGILFPGSYFIKVKIYFIFYLIKEFMKHSCLNFFYEIVNKISIKVKRN